MSIKDKTVLITGSRGGIGRDTAIALAKLGYKVIATVHREESVLPLIQYSKEQGVELEVFKLDILLEEDRNKILGRNVDILINNAGIGESGSLSEVPMDRIKKNFETNVYGTLSLTQTALSEMIKRDSGKVIIISSIAGRMVMPFWGPYNMTKYSLSAAGNVLKKELKEITRNVHIAVVEPGTYKTGFNQKVMNTRYEWMNENSYFAKVIDRIKKDEEKSFSILERKTNRSIVNKIIKAVEAKNPCLTYTAPWWQALYANLLRIVGK